MIKPLFPLGLVVITASAEAVLERRGQLPIVQTMFNRHVLGDWGDLDAEGIETNNEALIHGNRLSAPMNSRMVSRCGSSPKPTARPLPSCCLRIVSQPLSTATHKGVSVTSKKALLLMLVVGLGMQNAIKRYGKSLGVTKADVRFAWSLRRF